MALEQDRHARALRALIPPTRQQVSAIPPSLRKEAAVVRPSAERKGEKGKGKGKGKEKGKGKHPDRPLGPSGAARHPPPAREPPAEALRAAHGKLPPPSKPPRVQMIQEVAAAVAALSEQVYSIAKGKGKGKSKEKGKDRSAGAQAPRRPPPASPRPPPRATDVPQGVCYKWARAQACPNRMTCPRAHPPPQPVHYLGPDQLVTYEGPDPADPSPTGEEEDLDEGAEEHEEEDAERQGQPHPNNTHYETEEMYDEAEGDWDYAREEPQFEEEQSVDYWQHTHTPSDHCFLPADPGAAPADRQPRLPDRARRPGPQACYEVVRPTGLPSAPLARV